MDRQIAYPGQIPLEADLLNSNKYAMVGLAKLSAAILGTATVVNGLACVPTGPASLQVVVNPGEMYSLVATDASAYSSLSADAHNILKQGILLDAVTLTCTPPATAGQSINYLIQAAYQDSDTGLVTLPYYNASNPSQAWSGPGNSGAQQATARKGIVNISAKPGTAAATGSQTTPAPDAGFTGLWVVTVANGQTTITSVNIAQAANAPILPTDILHAMQQSATIVGVDTGAANAYAVSYNPAITGLADGMVLWFKVKTANTGASTLNVNGLGASPVVGAAHSALQGGEMVVGGRAQVVWRADISSWVLESCTGAALQVAPATQSQHAMQFGQAVGRYLGTRVFTANGTYTPTAGTNSVVVRLCGGGGGGGGTNATAAGNVAVAGGGGSGAYAEGRFTSGFSGATITIGAGGVGGPTSTSGAVGGATSFGVLLSAGGGSGGAPGPNSAPPYSQSGGNGATFPVSGNILNVQGGNGSSCSASSTSSFVAGGGGSGPLGNGAPPIGSTTAPGNSAAGYGGGGGGAATGPSGSGQAGGAGAPGVIIVHEYA
ncbi:MAG: phage tail protein [Cupriavidus sp.]|uniref:glycine-rich domain-containing protein n=1 Tax=Cupriavidus sp. TaxID=1873897 RepID=UPI0025BDEF39|nr:hypothetical protein [Cupriavidus sp.]MCA3194308.1 phage tail protein [Cupriavidus sp.]MCA3200416.1 phage tail protein [Cupriavidus sp.]